jgi:acylphosphatase
VRDVTFKDAVRRKAESFGLRGWVRDSQDGRVEAVFEGEPEEVRLMIRWCHSDRERRSTVPPFTSKRPRTSSQISTSGERTMHQSGSFLCGPRTYLSWS